MDHSEDRARDWWNVTPKWLLATIICGSWTLGGVLGGLLWQVSSAYLDLRDKYQSDPRWDLIAQVSREQGEQKIKIEYHEDRIKNMENVREEMRDLRSELRALNSRLARKGL